MESRNLKVALACFLGGFIGALVALSVAPYLWWVGLLAGFVVGYMSYEFKAVAAAIGTAWNAVYGADWHRAYQQTADWTRRNWHDTLCVVLILTSVFAPLFCLYASNFITAIEGLLEYVAMISLVMAILSLLILTKSSGRETLIGKFIYPNLPYALDDESPRLIAVSPLGTWVIIPILILLWILRHVLLGIGYLLPRMPRFVAVVFRTIHSDLRLLCGTDAAIGAGIGYLLGSPIFGGLAGAAIGVLNYEVVSKRWLHLVPARSANK